RTPPPTPWSSRSAAPAAAGPAIRATTPGPPGWCGSAERHRPLPEGGWTACRSAREASSPDTRPEPPPPPARPPFATASRSLLSAHQRLGMPLQVVGEQLHRARRLTEIAERPG